jgi:hypothetical protein
MSSHKEISFYELYMLYFSGYYLHKKIICSLFKIEVATSWWQGKQSQQKTKKKGLLVCNSTRSALITSNTCLL